MSENKNDASTGRAERGGANRGLWLLYAAAAGALALGVYARFKGLGAAALAADEYYIARSVDNILRFGVPAYDCGGYYTRGLPFQYLVAALRLAGLGAEASARLVAAVSSLLTLPAVWILGKRLGGRAVGFAAVAILAVSLWEVEIARFGRMYAPFQAIFAWYLVFFVRHTVDGDARARRWMLALSVLGFLTWEGGVFLPVLNVLPVFLGNRSGRIDGRGVRYIAANVALFLIAFVLVTADARWLGGVPPLPEDFVRGAVSAGDAQPAAFSHLWGTLDDHPLWLVLALVPLVLCASALRWIWSLRSRWPAALALLLALALAALHQLAGAASVLVIALLLGILSWTELASREARPYLLAILASTLFWLAFGLLTDDWREGMSSSWLGRNRFVLLAYEFIRFPDLLLQVGRAWSGAAPVFALALAALIAAALARSIAMDARTVDRPVISSERVLLLVLVCMLVGVGASDPPRQETRYVFFLFPVAVVIAVATIARFAERIDKRREVTAVAALAALALFMVTEDFRPSHLLHIDGTRETLRIGLPPRLEAHLVPRSDAAGAARWLAANAGDERYLVINAFPTADYYFPKFDFTFIDERNQRFVAYACRRGTYERWGNLPLVHSLPELQTRIAESDRAFMVASERDASHLLQRLASSGPRIVWTAADGEIVIVEFESRGPLRSSAAF